MAFCLNTSTARAMSPISSRLSRAGTSTARSPAASRPITPVIAPSGPTMLRPIRKASAVPMISAPTARISWSSEALETAPVAAPRLVSKSCVSEAAPASSRCCMDNISGRICSL